MWRSLALGTVLAAVACGNNGSQPIDAPLIDAEPTPDAPSFPANAPPVGDCADGWCWVYPLPQGYAINGLWGTSESDVWAFGYQAILHFDGTSWKSYAMAPECPSSGRAAWAYVPWGSAANDLWVTGGCTLHWDGTTWTGYPRPAELPGAETFDSAIGGLGPSDLWKGGSGRAFHWNGTEWKEEGIPYMEPLAFGGSGTTTLAVFSSGAIAQWSGSAWGYLDATSHPGSAAVVIDATHIVVAQDDGKISFWNGGTWTTETAPVGVDWRRMTATSFSDVWVTGSDDTGARFVYHWNGTSWSAQGAPIDRGRPTALWRDPSGALWLANESSAISVWNGTTWTAKTTGDNRATVTWGTDWHNVWTMGTLEQTLFGPSRSGTYWIVGDIQLMHWNGSAWLDAGFPYLYSDGYYVNAGWASAPDDVWVAGGKGTDRMLFHWDGSTWSSSGPFGTESGAGYGGGGFTSIWGAAANDIYAAAHTAVYHYDGDAWTPVAGLPGATSWAYYGNVVFGSSASDVYVLRGNEISRWDGTGWTVKTMPSTSPIGWANSPTDVWLTTYHYDGSLFVPYTAENNAGALVGSASDMFAFGVAYGQDNNVSEWVGGFGGSAKVGRAYLSSSSAWRTPDGHVFAAGRGLIVH